MRTTSSRALFVACLFCGITVGCAGLPQQSPKLLEIDGFTYVACQGLVWVTLEGSGLIGGGGTFTVTYTDANGQGHTLRGRQKVEVTDIPETVPAPMPREFPPIDNVVAYGKQVRDGDTFDWPNGTSARRHNGTWVATQRPNPACTRW